MGVASLRAAILIASAVFLVQSAAAAQAKVSLWRKSRALDSRNPARAARNVLCESPAASLQPHSVAGTYRVSYSEATPSAPDAITWSCVSAYSSRSRNFQRAFSTARVMVYPAV